MASEKSQRPVVFRASAGRKLAIGFVFLVLLPFLISLPIMVFLRFRHGYVADALTLTVMGVLFAFWMAFLLVHLLAAIRTKVAIDDEAVTLSVPNWRGPTPGFRLVERRLPHDEIKAIETRGEIYKELAVPMLMRSAWLVTKDDGRVKLGYAAEGKHDSALPINRIVETVCERAKVPLKDEGNVYVGSQYKVLVKGEPDADALPEVDDEVYDSLRRRNHTTMVSLAILLIALVVVGFLYDLYRNGFFAPGG